MCTSGSDGSSNAVGVSVPSRRGHASRHEWHFENRSVDLMAEGYDAAIGASFNLAPGIVARPLAPAHVIAVAAPAYMAGRTPPSGPGDLRDFQGVVMRSFRTGRRSPFTGRPSMKTRLWKITALPTMRARL
jgi:hypothetical protein